MGDKIAETIGYYATLNDVTMGITRPEAVDRFMQVTGLNAADATRLLWDTYQPHTLWYPFAAIGFASAVGILLYSIWVRKTEAGI